MLFLQAQLVSTINKKRTDTIYEIKKSTVNTVFDIWLLCFADSVLIHC
jgi:hypothetical protein